MPTQLAAPVLTLAVDNLSKLKSIDSDDIATVWAVFTKCKDNLENGRRLENISWRLWHRASHQGPTITSGDELAQSMNSISSVSVPVNTPPAKNTTSNYSTSRNTVSPSSFGKILGVTDFDSLRYHPRPSNLSRKDKQPVVVQYEPANPNPQHVQFNPTAQLASEAFVPSIPPTSPSSSSQNDGISSPGKQNISALRRTPRMTGQLAAVSETQVLEPISEEEQLRMLQNQQIQVQKHQHLQQQQLLYLQHQQQQKYLQHQQQIKNQLASTHHPKSNANHKQNAEEGADKKVTFYIESYVGQNTPLMGVARPMQPQVPAPYVNQQQVPLQQPQNHLTLQQNAPIAAQRATFSMKVSSSQSDYDDDDDVYTDDFTDDDYDDEYSDDEETVYSTEPKIFQKVSVPPRASPTKPKPMIRTQSQLSLALKQSGRVPGQTSAPAATTAPIMEQVPNVPVDFTVDELTDSLRQNIMWDRRMPFNTMYRRNQGDPASAPHSSSFWNPESHYW